MRTRSSNATSLLAAAVALLSACGDERAGITAPPSRPTAVIDDGSRGGNPDFFFLPPLVANPASHEDYDAGAFVGSWKPIVQVCRLTSALECETAGGQPIRLRTFQGSEVVVSAAEELYKVEWNTRETWASAGTYRARVALVGHDTLELGFIDVALLTDQQAIRSMRTGEIVPLQDGRTVPLKFRIERGAAVSGNTIDFAEGVVTDAGGTVATGQGGAGITFEPGWLPDGLDAVTVTVQRMAPPSGSTIPNNCHGLGVGVSWLRQYEGCYRIETYPAVGVIQQDAVVGVCSESPSESQVMYKSDPLPGGGRRVKALENVELPEALEQALNCDGFTGLASGPRSGSLRDRMTYGAMRVMASIGRAIAPQNAYALDFGEGGQLRGGSDDLSDFGWAIPVVLGEGSGGDQTVVAGQGLSQPISVRTIAAHNHHATPTYVGGVPVTFTVSDGDLGGVTAAVSAATVPSGTDGLATAPTWTLPTTPGTYTMTATIPDDLSNNPDAVPQHRLLTFTVTVVPAASIVLTDLVTGEDIGSSVQMVANSRRAWNAQLSSPTGSCQISPATGDDDMYVYTSQGQSGLLFNIEARTQTAEPRPVSVTCGPVSRTILVTITPAPTMVAASCTNPDIYTGGDNIERGFYLPGYPHVQLAGADLRLSATNEGSYTLRLTARYGSFLGPVIASSTATVNLGGNEGRPIVPFRWPTTTVPANATVAFSLTLENGPVNATSLNTYYDVANAFGDQADPSCPIIETEGTGSEAQPLDVPRRRGVRAVLYSAIAQ